MIYEVGWEDNVVWFSTEQEAIDYVNADLLLDGVDTWEEAVKIVEQVNAEGNYHEYICRRVA